MTDHIKHPHKKHETMHATWRELLRQMLGDEDIRGIEIGTTIRMLANCYDAVVNQNEEFTELSGPRLAILIRLLAEESFGNHNGINPTLISKYQNVSKNTVSGLLRGLEDQGLIERTLDPADKRRFLIHITPAGRELVRATGPERVQLMNQLASGLSNAEQAQLLALLEKLRDSLFSSGCVTHCNKENNA